VRFKLDENLDPRLAPLVGEDQHDVASVPGEGLSGASDDTIFDVCVRESRILVTLDLDFSNPFRFPPATTEGIIVIRPPRPTLPRIHATLAAALPSLLRQPLQGKLWIVEPGRIRVYDPEEDVS
jgi:predicted nuclease of predicted toxin-antitoxin system